MYTKSKRCEIRDKFLVEGCSLRSLAEAYHIRPATIQGWARAERWGELREAIESEAFQKRAASLVDEVARHNTKVLDAWDQFLDAVLDRLRSAEAIDVRDLVGLATVCEKLQSGQRICLNADAPGEEGPSKVIVEYQGLAVAISKGAGEGGAGTDGGGDANASE